MTSNIFFDKDIKNIRSSQLYKYEELYLEYLIIDHTYGKSFTYEEIYNFLTNYYGLNLNNRKLNIFLNDHFSNINGFCTTLKQLSFFDKVKHFKKEFLNVISLKEEDIRFKLNEYIEKSNYNYAQVIPYVYAIDQIYRNKVNEYYYYKFYKLVINFNEQYKKLEDTINSINVSYYLVPINMIIKNRIVLELLFLNGINFVGDFISVSSNIILIILSINLDRYIFLLSLLNRDYKTVLLNNIDKLFSSLSDVENEILYLRCGYFEKKVTLEEIGTSYDVTRERIRQLEKRATDTIISEATKFEMHIFIMFNELAKDDNRYISIDKIIDFAQSKDLAKKILFIIENANYDIKYNSSLNIVYNSSIISVDELAKEVTDAYGDIIKVTDYNLLNLFERSVISSFYKLMYSKYWMKKNIYEKDLILMLIDEYFSNGYRISNPEHYALLKKIFEERYSNKEDFPSDRSIVGFLDRSNYCLIDRGTYLNRIYCVQLPEELKEKIINYILSNGPIVYYMTIYANFEKDLKDLGVDNYFYLKGILDPELPSDILTKRNYLSTDSDITNSFNAAIEYFKSFDGYFYLDDLRQKFPAVKDYTFYGELYYEMQNGLIWVSSGKFIYIDKVDISSDTINDFKTFIDSVFDSMGTTEISARKIYAKLYLTNKDLLNRLKIVNDDYSTFSLINYLYKNDYGLNRPIISKDINAKFNQHVLVKKYLKSLDTFNYKSFKDYMTRMNIRYNRSYLSIMEDLSDEYVQYNIDSMVKKDIFKISDSDIKEINDLFHLIIERFNQIDTRTFNGYAMLPKIEFHWNKYLLAGVIRSFFSEEYSVENTSGLYKETDFIIRRYN